MVSSFMSAFAVVAVLVAIFDIYYGYRAFQKKEEFGKYLGLSAVAAGIVTIAYLCSILANSYVNVSIASTIYFVGIDWMLVSLTHFTYRFTDTHLEKSGSHIRRIIRGVAIFDTLVLFVNIFWEISVHYAPAASSLAPYQYEMKPLYIMHLAFTYTLVGLTLFVLFNKGRKTPSQYRNQYTLNILAILLVVALNAVFLYFKGTLLLSTLDFSIFGYSIAIFLMYWAAFEYRTNDMLKSLSMTIFENINQGIVLFDYNGGLIMRNRRAEQLLSGVNIRDDMDCREFIDQCGIPEEACREERASLHSELRGRNGGPMRCDYTRVEDDRGVMTGNLFVFTDASNDVDLLTGFPFWDDFKRFTAENPFNFDHPTAAVVFDIVGLSEVNRTFGREVGDQRIRNLVKSMQACMPQGTYFFRGYEAMMGAVCTQCTEEELQGCVERILDANAGTVMYGMSCTSDQTERTADELNTPVSRNVIGAVETAIRALEVKKLLSPRSMRSQTLTSLVRALQEADSDTEEHVQRTQKMGEELGKRIGLTDAQMADLKLLCLLHDIGKIGIPLEILNKPGKLTDEEWAVLQTHAEKGYQIAVSSAELGGIAHMILSHHERWDGKGYPEHLSKTNIPILSRVIALVDSYDAMVNTRAYRTAMTPERAQAEIRKCAGSQFDPDLAAEFLAMLEENPQIAGGEKTESRDMREFIRQASDVEGNGRTFPIKCSRYVLNLEEVIIEADDNFEDITGYRNREVLGKMSQYDLVPTEDRAFYIMQVNKQFAKGNVAYLKHEILCKDGSKIWVVCHGKRYYDSAVKEFRSEIFIFRTEEDREELAAAV